MNRQGFFAALIALAASAVARAQTRIRIDLQGIAAPSGSVALFGIDGTGKAMLLKLDPSLTVDQQSQTVRVSASSARSEVDETQHVTSAGQLFIPSSPVANGTVLKVFRNGLKQAIGVDYNIVSGAVSFLPGAQPVVGDSVTLLFWK